MFHGKIHYKWPFSIAMLVYQRVSMNIAWSMVWKPHLELFKIQAKLNYQLNWPSRGGRVSLLDVWIDCRILSDTVVTWPWCGGGDPWLGVLAGGPWPVPMTMETCWWRWSRKQIKNGSGTSEPWNILEHLKEPLGARSDVSETTWHRENCDIAAKMISIDIYL